MRDEPRTPAATLLDARNRARAMGLHHVHVGNISYEAAQSSYCAGCGARVIGRDWHALSERHLSGEGACLACGTRFPGVIERPSGTWGRQRRPVRILAP